MVLMALSISAFARIDVGVYGSFGISPVSGDVTAFNKVIPPSHELRKKEVSPAFDVGVYGEYYLINFLSVNAGVRYFYARPTIGFDNGIVSEITKFQYSGTSIPISVRGNFNIASIPWLVGVGYDVVLSKSKEVNKNYDEDGFLLWNRFKGEQKDYKGGLFFEFGAKFRKGFLHYGILMKVNWWDVYKKDKDDFKAIGLLFELFGGVSF